jgi:hypothetical protein
MPKKGKVVPQTATPVVNVRVELANPRSCGKHYFQHESPSGVSSVSDRRQDASDKEVFDYGVQVIRLARLSTGALRAQPIEELRPRKGATGIYYEKQMSKPLTVISTEDALVTLPVSPHVAAYVFLMRAFDEETGWRYFEIGREEATEGAAIHVPDLLSLVEVTSHAEADELLRFVKTYAGAEYE